MARPNAACSEPDACASAAAGNAMTFDRRHRAHAGRTRPLRALDEGNLAEGLAGRDAAQAHALVHHLEVAGFDHEERVVLRALGDDYLPGLDIARLADAHRLPDLRLREAVEEVDAAKRLEARAVVPAGRLGEQFRKGECQRLAESLPGGEAHLAVAADGLFDCRDQRRRKILAPVGERHGLALQLLGDDVGLRLRLVRERAGQQVVGHDSRGVDVVLHRRLGALEVLRRHVEQRAHVHHLRVLLAEEVGGAEVAHLRRAVGRQQDVGGFHVAVQQALGIGVLQGVADLEHDVRHARGWQQRIGRGVGRERAAGEVLHDQEAVAALRARLVDLEYVGVLELPRQAHLVDPEAFELPGILVRSGGRPHDLEGDVALVEAVPGQEDLGHSALSDRLHVLESVPQHPAKHLGCVEIVVKHAVPPLERRMLTVPDAPLQSSRRCNPSSGPVQRSVQRRVASPSSPRVDKASGRYR